MGATRPDIGKAARMLVEGRYVAIYERTADGIAIIVVVHAMRDPAHWLD